MQRPAQGSSSSPNPDLEAMKSAHSAAINSNEKIFPIFARKLASKDYKEYVSTVRKLAAWLGSEKAYYPAARPKIVELLEIALSAFVDTFVHHSASAEFAELLRQLVQAAIPFIHLFSEIELQSRLQRLIIETEKTLSMLPTSATRGNVPPQGAVAVKIPSVSLASAGGVHPQPNMPSVPCPQKSLPQIQPTSAPGTVQAVSEGSVHVDAPRAPIPTDVASVQTDANPPLVSPVTNAPQQPGENTSPSIPARPQPKRTRRAELSEELIARDLDWFKSNQASAIVREDSGASSSKAGETSPALASDTAHIPGRSPSPRKKTARMVPSRRLPRRISLDAAQKVESGAPASAFPPASEPPGEETRPSENAEAVSIQNVHEQKPSLERIESDARSATRDKQDSPHELTPAEPRLAIPNEPSIKPEIPQTDHWHQPPSVRAPLLNGEPSPRSSTLLPEAKFDGMESMDISASDLGSEGVASEPPGIPESTPPQSPQSLQLQSLALPPLVKVWEPPLNLNFNISQISPDPLQQSAIDMNQQRFDGEMLVIHTTQGKPFTHTHMIDINLNEHLFTKISKWANRKCHPSEAPHGVCISLACYRLPEFFDKIKSESSKSDIAMSTLQSSCSWPRSNRLSLHVNDETRQTTIMLSPPLFLTPDQCVDISSLMKPGDNTLEVRQHGDLSEYLVVLHAHHPTRAQLAELDVVKTADERWKRFLDVLSARVVPGKFLGTTPPGVVGVL